MQAHLIGVLEW